MMFKKSLLLLLALFMFVPALGEEPPDVDLPAETTDPSAEPTRPPDVSMLQGDGILRLVNRANRLDGKYVPPDLVTPRVATRKKGMEERIRMRREAALALENLFSAALREAEHTLYAASGYRSYGHQQILYNGRVAERGRERAERTVANPGASEHQMGLAMDIQSPNTLSLNQSFGDTEEGKWVAENAHRFGFIVRYQQQWTDITGYAYEPWHLRYLGVAHATAVHALDVPYETYAEKAAALPDYVLRGATDRLLVGLLRDEAGVPDSLLQAKDENAQALALRAATLPYLKAEESYEQVLWAIYPTPKPTAGPRVDTDEESSLFIGHHDGVSD